MGQHWRAAPRPSASSTARTDLGQVRRNLGEGPASSWLVPIKIGTLGSFPRSRPAREQLQVLDPPTVRQRLVWRWTDSSVDDGTARRQAATVAAPAPYWAADLGASAAPACPRRWTAVADAAAALNDGRRTALRSWPGVRPAGRTPTRPRPDPAIGPDQRSPPEAGGWSAEPAKARLLVSRHRNWSPLASNTDEPAPVRQGNDRNRTPGRSDRHTMMRSGPKPAASRMLIPSRWSGHRRDHEHDRQIFPDGITAGGYTVR